VWNRTYVESVQITMAEAFGVQGRGRFYEEVGAIRDVVQNHLLQVTSLLAMDAPIGHDADAIHAEKLRLFRAMRPLEIRQRSFRGQFRGYRSEAGVDPRSEVETFAALCLHIDTWRWEGVPFYIRAGKSLPITATEVIVTLKRPPLPIFGAASVADLNTFRFRLSPEVVISLAAHVKHPGEEMRGEPAELVARHLLAGEHSPYERLLATRFAATRRCSTRDDSVEAAWRIVDPVLTTPTPVKEYEPGTWDRRPRRASSRAARAGTIRQPKTPIPARAKPAAQIRSTHRRRLKGESPRPAALHPRASASRPRAWIARHQEPSTSRARLRRPCAKRHAAGGGRLWRIDHSERVRACNVPLVTGKETRGVAVLPKTEQDEIEVADVAQQRRVRRGPAFGAEFGRNRVHMLGRNRHVNRARRRRAWRLLRSASFSGTQRSSPKYTCQRDQSVLGRTQTVDRLQGASGRRRARRETSPARRSRAPRRRECGGWRFRNNSFPSATAIQRTFIPS